MSFQFHQHKCPAHSKCTLCKSRFSGVEKIWSPAKPSANQTSAFKPAAPLHVKPVGGVRGVDPSYKVTWQNGSLFYCCSLCPPDKPVMAISNAKMCDHLQRVHSVTTDVKVNLCCNCFSWGIQDFPYTGSFCKMP